MIGMGVVEKIAAKILDSQLKKIKREDVIEFLDGQIDKVEDLNLSPLVTVAFEHIRRLTAVPDNDEETK